MREILWIWHGNWTESKCRASISRQSWTWKWARETTGHRPWWTSFLGPWRIVDPTTFIISPDALEVFTSSPLSPFQKTPPSLFLQRTPRPPFISITVPKSSSSYLTLQLNYLSSRESQLYFILFFETEPLRFQKTKVMLFSPLLQFQFQFQASVLDPFVLVLDFFLPSFRNARPLFVKFTH